MGREFGCRTLAVFKGAGFGPTCAIRYDDTTELVIFTSLPSVAIAGGPFLGTRQARDTFVRILDEVRRRHEFLLIGFVIMPEHVHLLMSEPRHGDPSKSLQVLKQRVSRALRKRRRPAAAGQLSLGFYRDDGAAKAFWQRRFYDFNVWSAKKLREKLEYMHANPVRRKLVAHPKDWPWSSWAHYVKGEAGAIRTDTLCGLEEGVGADGGKSQKPHPCKTRKDAAPKFNF